MKSRFFDAWALTAAAAVLMAITMGSRSAFGLFVSPLNTATGLGLATIQPSPVRQPAGLGARAAVGRWPRPALGAARVIGAGGIVTAVATALVTVADSGGSPRRVRAARLRRRGDGQRRPAARGGEPRRAPRAAGSGRRIVGAGASIGQLVLAPAVQATIATAGWVAAIGGSRRSRCWRCRSRASFERKPAAAATVAPAPADAAPAASAPSVRDALATPGFWLVTGGFFVCGFHVSFLVAHMPGQIELCGLPATVSGVWLAIIGACNVAGSLAAGAAIERMSAKRLLIALYALRAIGVAAFSPFRSRSSTCSPSPSGWASPTWRRWRRPRA